MFRASVKSEGGAISVTAHPAAMTATLRAAGGAFSITSFDSGAFQSKAFSDLAAEGSAQRMVSNPRLFVDLANQAASSIQSQLRQLREKIPNEPEALNGYEQVRDTLEGLKTDFLSLVEQARSVERAENVSEKLSLAKTAVGAAQRMCAGFVGWLNENGPQAGRVIAELGLAGVITGALTYFTGVPPTLAFSATVAALKGESILEVIKLFAPGNKGEGKKEVR
ncbi:hypothetical protein [Bradyrhizobium sp. NAS96.2]|uniref:hypothetical protein n=1 Tax=Bradyrhizobium sp. NAS96.2 TaxID=1680160 RepID=UPI001FD9B4DD|nr:hypothetical protein [Bradyrhizobium sp. NAS96.2]